MITLPQFPYTEVKEVQSWANFHGTLDSVPIPIFCTPGYTDQQADPPGVRLARHGEALRAILRYCLQTKPVTRLRVLGSTWSMSTIVLPEQMALDPSYFNVLLAIGDKYISPENVSERNGKKFTPVYVEAGARIQYISTSLANQKLMIQTSGASDGHLLAGCIATASHGAALRVGAVHDTVRAVHLVVGPDQALFIQPKSAPVCTEDMTAWLQTKTGIPTRHVVDDELFHAAQVGLGALGFVMGFIVDAEPLYSFRHIQLHLPWTDPNVQNAIRTLDTQPLHPGETRPPDHFDVIAHPYPPDNGPGAYVRLLWKNPTNTPGPFPDPVKPAIPCDLIGLVASLAKGVTNMGRGLSRALVSKIVSDSIATSYPEVDENIFPYTIFGPTDTPRGHGISTEIVVNHEDTVAAVDAVRAVLDAKSGEGKYFLGGVGIRFTPASKALLGMNIHPWNTYIELPGVRNPDVADIQRGCWEALDKANLNYTCHWGQLHGMTSQGLAGYFGDRVDRWKRARATFLPDAASQRMFGGPFIEQLELDSPPARVPFEAVAAV